MTARFEDLTEYQKRIVSNGCGPRAFFRIDGHPFDRSCDRHDFDYFLGNTWSHKYAADKLFFVSMYVKANYCPTFFKRAKFKTLACVFFVAVFFFGHISFNYSARQRTIEEIMAAAK